MRCDAVVSEARRAEREQSEPVSKLCGSSSHQTSRLRAGSRGHPSSTLARCEFRARARIVCLHANLAACEFANAATGEKALVELRVALGAHARSSCTAIGKALEPVEDLPRMLAVPRLRTQLRGALDREPGPSTATCSRSGKPGISSGRVSARASSPGSDSASPTSRTAPHGIPAALRSASHSAASRASSTADSAACRAAGVDSACVGIGKARVGQPLGPLEQPRKLLELMLLHHAEGETAAVARHE